MQVTPLLDTIIEAFLEFKVPAKWGFAYPSLKPLAAWTRDLIARTDQLELLALALGLLGVGEIRPSLVRRTPLAVRVAPWQALGHVVARPSLKGLQLHRLLPTVVLQRLRWRGAAATRRAAAACR